MVPTIVLAPGAEGAKLASFVEARLRANSSLPRCARALEALRATVGLVDFDSGDAVSVRFDHGRVVVHEGRVGVPTVTFGGPRAALFALAEVRGWDALRSLLGLGRSSRRGSSSRDGTGDEPPRSSRPSVEALLDTTDLVRLYRSGELKIYGALRHPRTVARFLTVIAQPE